MTNFNFVSPGAMATDALQKFLADREMRQRQVMIDQANIAHQREQERMAREQEQRMADAATQAKTAQDAELAIRKAQEQRTAQTYNASQHDVGDTLTPEQMQGLPSGMTQPVAPAISEAVTPETNPAKQQGIYPGIVVSNAPSIGNAGPSTAGSFKGTPKQQAIDAMIKSGKLPDWVAQGVKAGVIDDASLVKMMNPDADVNWQRFVGRRQGGKVDEQFWVNPRTREIQDSQRKPVTESVTESQPDPLLQQARIMQILLAKQLHGDEGPGGAALPKDVQDTIDNATAGLKGREYGRMRQVLAASYDPQDPSTFNQQMSNTVVRAEDPATARAVEGRRDALKALDTAKATMNELKAAGVDTNLLRGSAEDLARKLGTTTNPTLVKLGSQLSQTLFEYRRAMTGVQFSQKEAEQYFKIFPKYTNDFDVNSALLDQMKSYMGRQQDNFWEQRLGKNYQPHLAGTVWDTKVETNTTSMESTKPSGIKSITEIK